MSSILQKCVDLMGEALRKRYNFRGETRTFMDNVVIILETPTLLDCGMAGSCSFIISRRSARSANVTFKLTTQGARYLGINLDPGNSDETKHEIRVRTGPGSVTVYTVFARNEGPDCVRIDAIVRSPAFLQEFFQQMLVTMVKFPGVEASVQLIADAPAFESAV